MFNRENIAAKQHEIWSHWMKYLFSTAVLNKDGSVTISAEKVARWTRQLETRYYNLPEKEKVSDREQADKVIAIL